MQKVASLYVSEPPASHFGNPPQAEAGWTNDNWLKSRFHFSFAEWPGTRDQMNFGALRVMNDDLVQSRRGFGRHGHRDMEIVTYIVTGELTHKDSMGNSETLGRGAVQFMSAGSGVQHEEHNLHQSTELRFLQMWVVPQRRGIEPRYGGYAGDAALRTNQWHHLVGPLPEASTPGNEQPPAPTANDTDASVRILQDAHMLVGETAQPDFEWAPLEVKPGRMAYLVCVEGALEVSDGAGGKVALARSDAVRLRAAGKYTVRATGAGQQHEETRSGPGGVRGHVLVWELAQ